MRKFLLICLALLTLTSPALADQTPAYITKFVPDATAAGSGRMRVLFYDVYDATLYAPAALTTPDKPFALSLQYLRTIKGNAIAKKSIEEMRRHGLRDEVLLATWHTQMQKIFPDVVKGTTLTGIYIPNRETIFFKDGEMIGRIRDARFGPYFFNIWLGPRTAAPDIRKHLLKGAYNDQYEISCTDRSCNAS